MKVNDLTNKKFGKLTVIKRSGDHIQPNGKKVTMWECKCECEKTKDVMADWSRELGIPFTTMLGRLRKGKSTEEILSKNKLAKRSGNGRWKAM